MKGKESLIRLILLIYRKSQTYIVPRASEFDIDRGQWYFFNKLLFDGDGITQEDLSKELVVDKAHTARAIGNLEKKGFLFREKNPNDTRKKEIFISDKSRQIEEDYHQIYKDLNKILVKDFSTEEVDLLMTMLSRMEKNINQYMDNKDCLR